MLRNLVAGDVRRQQTHISMAELDRYGTATEPESSNYHLVLEWNEAQKCKSAKPLVPCKHNIATSHRVKAQSVRPKDTNIAKNGQVAHFDESGGTPRL